MEATDWPAFHHAIPKWLPGAVLAVLFAIGAAGAWLVDEVTHRHRTVR